MRRKGAAGGSVGTDESGRTGDFVQRNVLEAVEGVYCVDKSVADAEQRGATAISTPTSIRSREGEARPDGGVGWKGVQ